jgi:hypothetical protein
MSDYAFVSNTTGTVSIIDISTPSAPVLVSTVTVGNVPGALAVFGTHLYVCNGADGTISVVDISHPLSPFVVFTVTVGSQPSAIVISGTFAYVALTGSGTGVAVLSLVNPVAPALVNTVATPGVSPIGLSVGGNYLYVCNRLLGNIISVIDITVPASAIQVATCVTGTGQSCIIVNGNHVYAGRASTADVVDVTVPLSPVVVGGFTAGGSWSPFAFALDGTNLYSTDFLNAVLDKFDVSVPSAPVFTSSVPVGTQPRGLAILTGFAYVPDLTAHTLSVVNLGTFTVVAVLGLPFPNGVAVKAGIFPSVLASALISVGSGSTPGSTAGFPVALPNPAILCHFENPPDFDPHAKCSPDQSKDAGEPREGEISNTI